MARKAREKSPTGIYHTLVRAIADLSLFTDNEDAKIYTYILKDLQEKGYCTVYTYALLENHLHILIREESETIGQIMKRIASAYSYFFNVKYQHYGPIYIDRFKSEPIVTRATFIDCIEFLMNQQTEYKGYITKAIPTFTEEDGEGVVNVAKSKRRFLEFATRPLRITDSRLLAHLQEHHNFTTKEEFVQRPESEQIQIVESSVKVGGSILQISRLLGITRKVAYRLIRVAKEQKTKEL